MRPMPELAGDAGASSLKICLRLQDETPFLGIASVHVLPDEGYEIPGIVSSTPGDFVFSDVQPGEYIVEVAAPGYLALRLKTRVDSGHRYKTFFVVMKPNMSSRDSLKLEKTGLTVAPANNQPLLGSTNTSVLETSQTRDFWSPHELEDHVPIVDPSVYCPTQELLKGVGQRMTEFVGTLEKFTAKESLEHYTFDAAGTRKKPETRSFTYVVMLNRDAKGNFALEEFRNGTADPEQFPARIASIGTPAIALLFHPILASDFEFRCEGLGHWEGRDAWQVHFVQREDRPVQIRSYSVGGRLFDVILEGRVWIDPGTAQILRLESELAKPIPAIELTREHLTIDYEPVQFLSIGQQVWLPRAAELFVERRGKRYYRRHTFSDFKLFNVDTAQYLQTPKGSYVFTNHSDREVTGELSVLPREGIEERVVTLRFTVPPHGKIFKVVGPGKDVNLPLTAVGSATFAHNGAEDSIQVDALLVNETTLDVIPGTTILQPQ